MDITTSIANKKYFPEIDGLRAFAVLSVIGFHFFPGIFFGGFSGVDIFFVISGFLISKNILENLKDNKFSYSDFIKRRIRRILPALLVVISFALIFSSIFLMDFEYSQLGEHAFHGALFVSNFLLISESGYFDIDNKFKPLMHLWSLSVEEQFYLIWPLILWVFWWKNYKLFRIILTVFFLSLILNLFMVAKFPIETFFLPFTRFWELISGAILAWIVVFKPIFLAKLKCLPLNNKIINYEFISITGIFFITVALFLINEHKTYPSLWTLIPIFGAIFIIISGSKSFINNFIFANPLMVWLGLISYPLYLWHWVIFSFILIYLDSNHLPHPGIRILVILVAITLSWLTYKFIEIPIRYKKNKFSKEKILIFILVIIGFTGFMIQKKYDENTNSYKLSYSISSYFNILDQQFLKCENRKILASSPKYTHINRCWQSKKGEPSVILLGDSHAESLFLGIAENMKSKNVAYYINKGLPSLKNKNYKQMFDELSKLNGQDKTIIITAFWNREIANNNYRIELTELIRYLQKLKFKIILLGDVPTFEHQPSICQRKIYSRVKIKRTKNDAECDLTLDEVHNQINFHEKFLKEISYKENILYLSANLNILCDELKCSFKDLFMDRHHLNTNGSKIFGADFASKINIK